MLSIVTDMNNLLMRQNLGTATNAVNIALQRMSTGYKINSAKDDAAGLYVATRLNTQINGLKQAQKNVQDGISVLQTAEGAYKNITDILLRLRELSLQSANGIFDINARNAMQAEADQLVAELQRIQKGTSFNGLSLFNNPPGTSVDDVTPTLASTFNILDTNQSENGTINDENGSGSTFSLLRSAPMMRSAAPASTNNGVALMSLDDENSEVTSTITSNAYDFTANQTQTITIGEGEHQRSFNIKNKTSSTASITINFDTGTGQITLLGSNFEIKANEMDKTYNLLVNGAGNYVYGGDLSDTIEIS